MRTFNAKAFVALVLAAVALASCVPPGGGGETAAQDSTRIVETLTTWFECEECQEGELAAVTKYGERVVPTLTAVLNNGLSPATRENLRLVFEERYDTLAARARTKENAPVRGTKAEFVGRYLSNFDAQYRVRAAQALAAIGGQSARSALETAAARGNRPDVAAEITRLLRTMR